MENIKSILMGVAGMIVSAIVIGGFTLYTEFQIIKVDVQNQKTALQDQKDLDDKFEALLVQFDKALAVQAETVKYVKNALEKLGDK